MTRSMPVTFDSLDRRVHLFMRKYGHATHRCGLGVLFLWFGLLKPFGYKTTTSLLADTVYFGDPQVVVPILGLWEAMIGLCLLLRRLIRIGLLLLMVRLPGTLLALVLMPEVCFEGHLLIPTPEGQYLIKDLVLFTAALIIGGTVREERPRRVFH